MTKAAMDPVALACYHGFRDMCRTDIIRFAGITVVEVDAGASLFQTLLTVIMAVLKINAQAALPLVALRHCSEANNQYYAQHLMNMDAAIEVVDPQDQQSYVDEQKHAVAQVEHMEEFVLELAEKRKEVDQQKKPRRDAGGGRGPGLPRDIDQREARRWIPPGSHIWVSRTRNEWWGHMAPYKRITEKWHLTGEDQAVLK